MSRVIVLGAGVVGTAAAAYLARDGHAVSVIERQPEAGLETSFANGGQISASHAEPWANPGTPRRALRWLGRRDAPLVMRLRWDPALFAWGLRFLRNCTARRTRVNIERTLRIALYSRAQLARLADEIGIEFDRERRGILHVYRDPREYRLAAEAARLMADLGCRREPVAVGQAVTIEPALAASAPRLAGAIHSPDDESGDAFRFTQGLAAWAAGQGVEFRYGERVLGFERDGARIAAVVTDRGRVEADWFVLACGSYSAPLARTLGLHLPIVPAKGYSATLPVADPQHAPRVSITDDERKIVISRLGGRLRIAGTAEFAGYDTRIDPLRAEAVLRGGLDLFPGAGEGARAEYWAGLRPKTPDSVPILGRTPVVNLLLDTGHGTLGWTMACGSGRVIADLVAGRAPEIDLDGLGLERF